MGRKKKWKLDLSKPLTDEDMAEWDRILEEKGLTVHDLSQEERNARAKYYLHRAEDGFEILKHWDDDSNRYTN